MQCPQCRQDSPAENAFCGQCGAKLVLVCPNCKVESPAANRFCGSCGSALPGPPDAEAEPPTISLEQQFHALQSASPATVDDALITRHQDENRFVTVLFADMTSSVQTTHGLRADEAASLVNRLLTAMVESLKRFDGRIDRFLGDGVLAVFGTPHAHENDPERAIRAAMAIRDVAAELGLGVTAGINSGEVFFGEMGSEQHRELTVMGPVVNLAARLQGQAEAGQILVGEATHRHTRRMFRSTDLSVEIKGIDRPVAAHRVEEALPRPERVRGIEGLRAELIGRDREFSDLKETLTKAAHGDGQIATVIGEAGVGKSRLTSELQQFAMTPTEDRPAPMWLEGRCVELGVTASYWPFIDALHAYFAWHTADDDSVRATAIVDALQGMVSDGSLAEEQMDEMGPLLGHLLAVEFGNDWDDRLKFADGQQMRHQTFHTVRDFLVALSRRQPLVLVLDDLHWADALSTDLVSLLMESLSDTPIFLLCVYRPEQEHRCWRLGSVAERKCPERFHDIRLRELTPDESRALVEALLTIEDVPDSLKEMILEKAHGNPFFVEEVVRSLIDSGAVYHDGDVWTAAEGIESVAVPETVQSIVLSRVDRLEAELRHVLQSASVIGRVFPRRVLERVATQSSDIEQALWELECHALIYQGRTVPEPEYVFRHALTQDAVYQTVVQRRRTEFHGTVAREMEALYADDIEEHVEQLAYHYELSDDDEKAVEYLVRAAEKARRNYLNEQAIDVFQRALSRLSVCDADATTRAWERAASLGLGKTYDTVGDLENAEPLLRRNVALTREMGLPPREIVRAYYWLAECLYWRGAHEERRQIGEECLALLAEDSECVEAALANAIVTGAVWALGDAEGAWEYAQRNARFIDQLPYCEELRFAYFHIAFFLRAQLRDLDGAEWWTARLMDVAVRHHDTAALGFSYPERGLLTQERGDLRAASAEFRTGLDICDRIGDAKTGSVLARYVAYALVSQGRPEDAAPHVRRSLDFNKAVGFRTQIGHCLRAIGEISLCQGAYDEALEAFGDARAAYRYDGVSEPVTGLGLAWTHLARADHEQARACFLETTPIVCDTHPSLFLTQSVTDSLLLLLSGLEDVCDPDVFSDHCAQIAREHPALVGQVSQWRLHPTTTPGPLPDLSRRAALPDSTAWLWHDPFGDCSWSDNDGTHIHAASGRDFQEFNASAPRLVQTAEGDFVMQTRCQPAMTDRPGIGGLLIWQDEENYLRLDIGTRGPHEVSFSGRLASSDVTIGRGRLPAAGTRLRLERAGSRVRSLCSAEGEVWFTAGESEFPVEGPLEVGVHAIGDIDRIVYPGAFPNGTAIRFDEFRLSQ